MQIIRFYRTTLQISLLNLICHISIGQNALPTCSCTVDAGKDIEICEPGGTVKLNGNVTGNVISYNWLNAPELSDLFILNPDADITQNSTFTLTTKCKSNTFVPIINANFSNGNTGFTHGYIYDAAPGTFGPGHLTVTNAPQSFNSGFGACGDHTSGSGNMLLVDGSDVAGTDVWCQNVTMQANTDYLFEFWATNVYPVSPANLLVTCNGIAIGSATIDPEMCLWQKISICFTPVATTNAAMCISEVSGIGFGNDFAIDDISLQEVCRYEDKVNVTVLPTKTTQIFASICEGQTYTIANQTFQNEGTYDIPLKTWKGCDSIITLELKVPEVNAEIDPPLFLGCVKTSVLLNGDNSSFGSEYTYLWKTADGNILTDPKQWEVNVDKPGKYDLTVTYNDGTIICSKTVSVTVQSDTTKPTINAGMDGKLSCSDTLLTLIGSVTSPSNYNINWSTPNGSFLSKTDTLTPVIGSAGLYLLTVTDKQNLCTTIDTVIISTDSSLPLSTISGIKVLSCFNNSGWLDGTKSDTGPNFEFKWNTLDGNINSNPDSLLIEIDAPGKYDLTITNKITGCKTTTSYSVIDDLKKPTADAGNSDTLSCLVPNLILNGTSDLADSLASFIWTTSTGNILSGNNSKTPTINAEGNYTFTVLNLQNGCSETDSVFVTKDANTPLALIVKPDTITCLKSTIDILAPGSSTGPNFTYTWTTINGNILGPVDSINIISNSDGVYILTVKNQVNGCISADTVTIIKNTNPPIADAGNPITLTCTNPTLKLNAGNSSSGNIFVYLWSTTNGNISAGSNTLFPDVTIAGTYNLLVSNNENGCTANSSVDVFVDKIAPDVSVSPDAEINCINPVIQLNAINNSTPGNFIYTWSTSNGTIVNGQTTLNPMINKAGVYILTTTNTQNGCTDEDIVTVVSNGEIPEINAGSDSTLTCLVSVLSLQASLKYTGGNIDIDWTTSGGNIISGANTLNPQINAPGIYTITVADPNTGCTNFDQILISIDTLKPNTSIINPEKLSCKKLSTSLEVSANNQNWSYQWTTVNGNIIGPLNTFQTEVISTGNYQVQIQDNQNGCTASFVVIVLEDIAKPQITAGPDKTLTCDQQNVNLSGNISSPLSNYALVWNYNNQLLPGATNLNPNVSLDGSYVLIVTNELNGCSALDTVFVAQNTNIPNDLIFEIFSPGCKNTGKILVQQTSGGAGPYSYSINGGTFQSSPDFTQLPSGNYDITVKDQNGCIYQESAYLPEPVDIKVTLPELVTIEFGENGQLLPTASIPENQISNILWTPSTGLSCDNCYNPFVLGTDGITYTLTISDLEGCTASDNVRVRIVKNFDLYIPNAFSPDLDGINDVWFVFGDPKKVTNIKILRIYDRWGALMFEASNFPPNEPDYGWNGKSKGKLLNPAVFVYYLEAEFIDGSSRLYKGDITISR